MEILFVGGPGRSGTSFVADRLGTHPRIAALKDIELKVFCEKNGLLDLFHSLAFQYSPNRGSVAMAQFRRMVDTLIEGRHGQRPLNVIAPAQEWHYCFDAFCANFTKNGHVTKATRRDFIAAARALVQRIASLAGSEKPNATLFLEKTPHALLALPFLSELSGRPKFLHVMRDPRSIAHSLMSMPWGPETLSGCCEWVASYCQEWARLADSDDFTSADLKCVHIEAVARESDSWSSQLSGWLVADDVPDLFKSASATVLNGWVSECPTQDMAHLNHALREWVHYFGYREAEIGALCELSESVA